MNGRLHRSHWRPRSALHVVLELALSYMSISYGTNLIVEYTPQPVGVIVEKLASLDTWGWWLIAGAALLIAGIATHSPALVLTGHGVQIVCLTALGVAAIQLNAFSQVVFVLGVALHPVMVLATVQDVVRIADLRIRK